jgi:hypothetical protein
MMRAKSNQSGNRTPRRTFINTMIADEGRRRLNNIINTSHHNQFPEVNISLLLTIRLQAATTGNRAMMPIYYHRRGSGIFFTGSNAFSARRW